MIRVRINGYLSGASARYVEKKCPGLGMHENGRAELVRRAVSLLMRSEIELHQEVYIIRGPHKGLRATFLRLRMIEGIECRYFSVDGVGIYLQPEDYTILD